MSVRVTKGGKGPVGSKVKSPGGKFIHERKKAVPKKKGRWRTGTTKKGIKIRQYWDSKKKKWITQSVLKEIKR